MSEIRAIWAGHAATPTIEERRAALKVGQVIADPALLAKGMRVVCNGLEYELGVREEAKGCWHVSNKPGVAFGDFGVRNGPCPLTFLGWAQEEKAGECGWMSIDHSRCLGPHAHEGPHSTYAEHWERIQAAEAERAKPPAGKPDPTPTGLTHLKRGALQRTWCGAPRDERAKWSPASADCPACLAAIERPPEPRWERIAFLGWDQEGPAIQAGDAVAMGPDGKLRKGGYATAGKLDPRICNAEQCGFHHDPSDPACVRAKHRTPPTALPFKRHPDCHMPSIHVVEVMCMGCEAAIATEATDADRNAAHERALQAPSRADACPPSPSGLGGTVGPILSRLR